MSDVGDLAYGDLVLRLDGSVIELLMISRDGAYRVHANHAQVSLKPTKHGDELEIRIGTNYRQEGQPSGPIVTDGDVHAPWGPFKVPITEQDRPGELFAEAERRRVAVLDAVSH